MPILALKDFEFRRVKYSAGDALPEGILRSLDLRELQRRGYVPRNASVEMARAPRVAATASAAIPEAPAWLLEIPKPKKRRG